MRSLLKGKRVYIDTNIFIYVALKHPRFYEGSRKVLEMLVSEEFKGYGSHFVAFELFGSLSRISVEAAYEAVNAYLDMPITMLHPVRETYEYARLIASLSKTTYDAIHAALIAQHRVEVMATEDLEDWRRILRIWPEVAGRTGARSLTVLSPTRGIVRPT